MHPRGPTDYIFLPLSYRPVISLDRHLRCASIPIQFILCSARCSLEQPKQWRSPDRSPENKPRYVCTHRMALSHHSRPSAGACWPPPSAPGTSSLGHGWPWFYRFITCNYQKCAKFSISRNREIRVLPTRTRRTLLSTSGSLSQALGCPCFQISIVLLGK